MDMMKLNKTSYKKFTESVNTVLIPIGTIEAHGPHASLGTDILIPREFVKRLENKIGDKVLMAPEVAYGHSWSLSPFPGTINISPEIFSTYVYEVGKGFINNGMKNVILFNGHGGNISSLNIAAEKLTELGAVVLNINWWLDYRDEIIKYAPDTGHAGEDETSTVLAIDEELVDMDQLEPFEIKLARGIRYKGMEKETYPNAYSGSPAKATVEKGNQIYESLVPLIIKEIENMWTIKR